MDFEFKIKKGSLRLFISFIFCLTLLSSTTENYDLVATENIVNDFIKKIDGAKTLQLNTIIKERIKSNYATRKGFFKIQASPYKLYMKEEYPVKGREVLYVEGQNNNKAWINPAAFPWATLSLSPIGNMMREGSHHSIYKSGYFFIKDVLKHMKTKYHTQLADMLKYEGLVNYDKILCHKITFNNPNFGFTTYKTLPKETLEDISRKLLIDDYMILEKNPQLKSFEDIKPGMILKVPVDYGKSFTLYITKETNLLIGIKAYDDIGLWEEYTYSNVVLNPVFSNLDFSIDNPGYGF